jgi:hypothetical protein
LRKKNEGRSSSAYYLHVSFALQAPERVLTKIDKSFARPDIFVGSILLRPSAELRAACGLRSLTLYSLRRTARGSVRAAWRIGSIVAPLIAISSHTIVATSTTGSVIPT